MVNHRVKTGVYCGHVKFIVQRRLFFGLFWKNLYPYIDSEEEAVSVVKHLERGVIY